MASKLLGTERTLITAKSWLVSFDGHPRYKGIEHRLGPALWTLERYNLDRYHAPLMDWWMEDVEELAAAVRNMRTEAVITAEVFPTREPYPNGRLFIAPTGGWVYGGPDSSLAVLESYLAEHLWVVHESTGNGWHWQRPGQSGVTGCEDGWSAVRDSVVEVE